MQTAVSGTGNTVKADTEKIFHGKFISGSLYQTEAKNLKPIMPTISEEISPKNQYCLRYLEGNYGKSDDILRYLHNGKLRRVQNEKTEKDS